MNSLLREIRKKINNRKRNKTTQDRERGVSFDELFDKMEKVIVQKQLFLDCGYRITDLAREVGTNRTYITRILKERGLNYVTYLNSFRIQYAMLLMSDPENRKVRLADIAERSGFASDRAMNRYLVRRIGVTAAVFRKRALDRCRKN